MLILGYFPLLIDSIFLIVRVLHFKKLQIHIKYAYPNEWDKLSLNKMGMKESNAKSANMEESIKSGFLSKQQDPLIVNFHRKDKFLITVMAMFVFLQLVIAFIQ